MEKTCTVVDANIWIKAHSYENPLLRLEDNLFSHKLQDKEDTELRIETPQFTAAFNSFMLASCFFSAVKNLNRQQLEAITHYEFINGDGVVGGVWKVKRAADKNIFQNIPMLHTVQDRRVVHLILKKDGSAKIIKTGYLQSTVVSSKLDCKLPEMQNFALPPESKCENIDNLPFTDSFTQLAAIAFQTIEPLFTVAKECSGAFCFRISENTLELIPIARAEREQNAKAVYFYKKFIIREYGKEFLDYIEGAYGFSLDDMIHDCKPLCPDHVFKVNIGVNHISLEHVELLYKKLHALLKMDGWIKEDLTYRTLVMRFSKLLCTRELRGLDNLFAKEKKHELNGAAFLKFLQALIGTDSNASLKSRPLKCIDSLISIFMPQTDEYSRIYTGRAIKHLAICGYDTNGTKGEKQLRDPCRDFFELLHIFPQMEKMQDWKNWKELLAHVVCKKTVFREFRVSGEGKKEEVEWKVGTILPAPRSKDGTRRWYYVDAYIDDHAGTVNYVLHPAAPYKEGEKILPLIDLFRSTASDHCGLSPEDSLEADLNPWASSPSDLKPHKAFAFKKKYIWDRTIPAWVGHLLHAESLKIMQEEKAKEALQEGIKELIYCLSDNKADDDTPFENMVVKFQELQVSQVKLHPDDEPVKMLSIKLYDELSEKECLKRAKTIAEASIFDPKAAEELLYEAANVCKELPAFKIDQDIHFVGHSLGASLAQSAVYYFGPRCRRIPLPGGAIDCFALNGPAITVREDEAVKRFVASKYALIKELGVRYSIFHRFEMGDFVPQAGQRHLGTGNYPEIVKEYFYTEVLLFTPREGAKALEITTMPTHGRRIYQAAEKVDYTIEQLRPQDVLRFHVLDLPKDLKKKFGFKFLNGPLITEVVRRVGGFIPFLLLQVIGRVRSDLEHDQPQQRGHTGVFFIAYDNPEFDFI